MIGNAWDTLWRSLKLDGYNLVISQIAVIFPFIIQAPRLFAGTIKLGDVMQTSQAFGQVEDALSFFRSSYDSFAGYRAVLDRLSGFEQNVAASAKLSLPVVKENASALVTRDLTVNRPDGRPLLTLGDAGAVKAVYRGERRIKVRREPEGEGSSSSGRTSRRRGREALEPVGAEERPLFDALKAWRKETAAEQGVPPYVVFHDRTLLEIARGRPGTAADLSRIGGVGEGKLARYGAAVLKVVREA